MNERQKNLLNACANALYSVVHQGDFHDSDFFITESIRNDLEGIEGEEVISFLTIRLKDIVLEVENKN